VRLPQHSPTFGQCASWQTVWRRVRSRVAFTRSYPSPLGNRTFSQWGFAVGETSSFWEVGKRSEVPGMGVSSGSPAYTRQSAGSSSRERGRPMRTSPAQ